MSFLTGWSCEGCQRPACRRELLPWPQARPQGRLWRRPGLRHHQRSPPTPSKPLSEPSWSTQKTQIALLHYLGAFGTIQCVPAPELSWEGTQRVWNKEGVQHCRGGSHCHPHRSRAGGSQPNAGGDASRGNLGDLASAAMPTPALQATSLPAPSLPGSVQPWGCSLLSWHG